MKVTEEMISAACESCPDLNRETAALAIQAAFDSSREQSRPKLTRLTVFYIVLSGVLAVLYAIVPPFVSFGQLAFIGFGLMAFLIIGFVALACAWLRPTKPITH